MGQVGLIFVEGEEFVRTGLAGYGDVEEIHRADRQVAGMDGAEFVGGVHGVGPTELDIGPVAKADFFFEGADKIDSGPFGKRTHALKLPERIKDFDALPWCPDDEPIGTVVEILNGFCVMQVSGIFVSHPPRSIRVGRHFFRERKNATVSRSCGVPASIASDSASSRVIFARLPIGETTN